MVTFAKISHENGEPQKKNKNGRKQDSNSGSSAHKADALTTRPMRRSVRQLRSDNCQFPKFTWK